MKNFILFVMTLTVALNIQAQSWEQTIEKGDELLGTMDRVKYKYVDSLNIQAIAFYSDGDYWKIGVGGKVFQPDKRGIVIKKTYNPATYATIGFYDEHNQLIEKWENCLLQLAHGFQVAETTENFWGKTTKGAREVVPYLRDQKGYVRIIVPVVRGNNFDLKIPCLNNAKREN